MRFLEVIRTVIVVVFALAVITGGVVTGFPWWICIPLGVIVAIVLAHRLGEIG